MASECAGHVRERSPIRGFDLREDTGRVHRRLDGLTHVDPGVRLGGFGGLKDDFMAVRLSDNIRLALNGQDLASDRSGSGRLRPKKTQR